MEQNLQGRFAQCSCGKVTKPSSKDLAFFEYRGEGSSDALTDCKHCGYHEVAHDNREEHWAKKHICDHFEPHGAYKFDMFYCGCRGWD